MPTNLYFRFDTRDLFTYNEQLKVLPKGFFNFITISHCLFFDQEEKKKSFKVYRKIFQESLSNDGYAIIIVQGRKIFRNYYLEFSENRDIEKKLIENLMADIGLNLVWYKYLASTGQRMPSKSREYGIFARENLPHQKYMEKLKRQYLQSKHYSSYGIDDYIILGKK